MSDHDQYCKECGACGEEYCCPPTQCKQTSECDYRQSYLKDLKFGYEMYMWAIDNIEFTPEQESMFKKKWLETFNKYYHQDGQEIQKHKTY